MSRDVKRYLLVSWVMALGLWATDYMMHVTGTWWPLLAYAAFGVYLARLAVADHRAHSPYWQRRREWERGE